MKQEMSVVGIDIAKRLFHLVGMDARGNDGISFSAPGNGGNATTAGTAAAANSGGGGGGGGAGGEWEGAYLTFRTP